MAAATIPAPGSTVDPAEVARFDALAADWWNPQGPMRVLHRFNRVRLAYIREHASRHFGRDPREVACLSGLSILDIGCGGGILSEPLARQGASVTGIDPAEQNIAIARRHAGAGAVAVDYRATTAEALRAGGAGFDIVLAMEVVEHVADLAAFLQAATAMVKPGGLFFAATLNRTMKSYALAIVGAEYVLGWLPRGTHSWERFVTPAELVDAILAGGLEPAATDGVTYDILGDRWQLSRDTDVNYMVMAEKRA